MKPILFQSEMVRAILEDRKTVTRRAVKPQPQDEIMAYIEDGKYFWSDLLKKHEIKPPYSPGDILYVRETWYYESHMEGRTTGEPDLPSGTYSHRYIFKADCPDYSVDVGVGQHGWRPSIHMPREAARIFLLVTKVYPQKLKDVSDSDTRAEGFKSRSEFISAILKMYPDFTEDSWFWANEFERYKKPTEKERYEGVGACECRH